MLLFYTGCKQLKEMHSNEMKFRLVYYDQDDVNVEDFEEHKISSINSLIIFVEIS